MAVHGYSAPTQFVDVETRGAQEIDIIPGNGSIRVFCRGVNVRMRGIIANYAPKVRRNIASPPWSEVVGARREQGGERIRNTQFE
jgi:hypothetical protein